MRKNKTNKLSEDNEERLNQKVTPQNLATNSASSSVSRRSFLGRVSASTAVAAAASVGLPSLLLSEKATAADDGDGSSRRA